jgi:hypothetical protein
MMQCKTAIMQGYDDYELGVSSHNADGTIAAPYKPPTDDIIEETEHGQVRIHIQEIDFQKQWLLGWNIADLIYQGRQPNDG